MIYGTDAIAPRTGVVEQAIVPCALVTQIARHYSLNGYKIFNWLKDPKFAPDVQADKEEARFQPVEVIAELTTPEPTSEKMGLIELELANGHGLRISGGCNPDAVARLVWYLT